MTVVETRFFLRKAVGILDVDERARVLITIGLDSKAGDIIPETGGVRERNSLRFPIPELVQTYRQRKTP